MAITVLLILAAMWAAVLLPPILRARTVQRSGDTIGDFRRSLNSLGRRHHEPSPRGPIDSLARLQGAPTPTATMAPVRRPGEMTPMQRRRRDVLLGLAGASTVTFLMAFMTGSTFGWFLWVLSTGALGAYVWMLLRMKQTAQERKQKVRYLDTLRPQAEAPARHLALTRSAGS